MWRWQAGGTLQVHEFPPFNTSRTGEGSWVMTNHIGTFTCKVRASFLSGLPDIGSLFGWVICARKPEPEAVLVALQDRVEGCEFGPENTAVGAK